RYTDVIIRPCHGQYTGFSSSYITLPHNLATYFHLIHCWFKPHYNQILHVKYRTVVTIYIFRSSQASSISCSVRISNSAKIKGFFFFNILICYT
ncbi:hypothetical protein L9F63_019248, partial [Diploptera punctata]